MKVELDVTGLPQLTELLTLLPGRMQDKILVAGLRAAGRVVAAEARIQVAKTKVTGELQKSITSWKRKGRGEKGKITIRAGVRGKEGPLAHLIEYGLAAHKIAAKKKPYLKFFWRGRWWKKKQVQHPGAPARPFLRPAADAKKDESVAVIQAFIKKGIDREVEKIAQTTEYLKARRTK